MMDPEANPLNDINRARSWN